MRSFDDPSSMTPDERLSEVATILAAGVLRLHARAALSCDNPGPAQSSNHRLAFYRLHTPPGHYSVLATGRWNGRAASSSVQFTQLANTSCVPVSTSKRLTADQEQLHSQNRRPSTLMPVFRVSRLTKKSFPGRKGPKMPQNSAEGALRELDRGLFIRRSWVQVPTDSLWGI